MSDIDNYAESNMENICLITSENMDYFAPFILSNAKTLILANEPVVAFGYVFEGTACGAICGYIEKSHFEIISLYVAPDYRRRGVATALMTALSDMLSDFAGVISVDFVITNEEHNLLACMLEKYGFRRLPDVTRGIYRTTIERIFDSDLFERYNGEEPFTPFAYISREKLTEAEQQATARDLPVPEDGFLASSVDMNCSFIHIIKNELKAYVVVEKNSDGSLLVSGVANCMNNSMILIKLLHDAAAAAIELYPEETPVLVQTVNKTAEKLLLMVDDNAEIADRHYELIL